MNMLSTGYEHVMNNFYLNYSHAHSKLICLADKRIWCFGKNSKGILFDEKITGGEGEIRTLDPGSPG